MAPYLLQLVMADQLVHIGLLANFHATLNKLNLQAQEAEDRPLAGPGQI